MRKINTLVVIGVSQSSVSRIIDQVSTALCMHWDEYVIFPDENEKNAIAQQFFLRNHLPGVFGCIDGSQIEIKRPSRLNRPLPERYFNRKSRYALNMMVVMDHRYKIRYFSARFPGSVHDSRIFNESFLKQLLLLDFNPEHPRYLIGDEAYACSNILLTPIQRGRADTPAKVRFSKRLRGTRWHIEAGFGVLKSRFRTLLKEQRTCLRITKKVIRSIVILHNYHIIHENGGLSEIDNADQHAILQEYDEVLQQPLPNEDPENFLRNRLIQNVFTEE